MATNYTNSSLVYKTIISPYYYDRKGKKISKITIHHAAGNASLDTMGQTFRTREASTNYGIDSLGRVAMFVEEKYGAWASCSESNDTVAVTIEVANCSGSPNWEVTDAAYNTLIKLIVDICMRNGIRGLNYTGDATGNLTRHNMFVPTICPGPYLQGKFPEIVSKVNAAIKGTGYVPVEKEPETVNDIYRVQVGAFAVKENAEKLKAKLTEEGFSTYLVMVDGLYKVQVGAYKVKANAEKMEEKLISCGYQTIVTMKTGTAVVEPTMIEYRVKPNDAVSLIAEKYQTSVNKIVKDNKLYDPNMIYVNQILKIYPGVK